jgi:hypothetical protein
MRFHSTIDFGNAHREYQGAMKEYATFDDKDPEAERRADLRLDEADEAFFGEPATTPTEIITKIEMAKERGGDDFSIETFYSVERMKTDLARQQGWPVSARMLEQWMAWRKLQEQMHGINDAEEEQRLSDLHAQGYVHIAMLDCTTPGDFILKQYLRLLTTHGGTLKGAAKTDMTGNPWDIDIADSEDEARFETADKIGCYDDIDNTDIGANLLAYGLPYFDAEAWMEAADRIGMQVSLVQQRDGSWSFGQQMDLRGEDRTTPLPPRLRREHRRLQGLLAKDFGVESRVHLVAEEIRREWPQLIIANPAAPVTEGEPA